MNLSEEVEKEIERHFPKIQKQFTDLMLWEFIKTPKENLGKFNAGIGTLIRVKFLRPENVLLKEFVKAGYSDQYEMTMIILNTFHEFLLR